MAALCERAVGAAPDLAFPNYHWGGYDIAVEGKTGIRWDVTREPLHESQLEIFTHLLNTPLCSNVIFSEGLLDPWHGGGFYEKVGGRTGRWMADGWVGE